MNRNKFITVVLAFTAAPVMAFSRLQGIFQTKKGFVTKAGEGRKHGHIELRGVNENVLNVKISGTDTNGDLAIFEQTSLSQGRGTPLHIHHRQDETFFCFGRKLSF